MKDDIYGDYYEAIAEAANETITVCPQCLTLTMQIVGSQAMCFVCGATIAMETTCKN